MKIIGLFLLIVLPCIGQELPKKDAKIVDKNKYYFMAEGVAKYELTRLAKIKPPKVERVWLKDFKMSYKLVVSHHVGIIEYKWVLVDKAKSYLPHNELFVYISPQSENVFLFWKKWPTFKMMEEKENKARIERLKEPTKQPQPKKKTIFNHSSTYHSHDPSHSPACK